jgi:hypothetical protein
LLLLAACSAPPEPAASKTVTFTPERLAEIRSKPYVKRAVRASEPTAALGEPKGDRWPGNIRFLEVDPYLEQIGLDTTQMIVEVDGKSVRDIFLKRWQTGSGRRPEAFDQHHYKDLIRYLFVDNDRGGFVLTVYLDIPGDVNDIPSYVPKVERWRVRFQ